QALGLGSWYESLPQGLETVLASGSGGLSAGEAQLLAFTRIFLRDPGLVILDEASSRLDPATEQLIERAVDRLLADRTGIIIAHLLLDMIPGLLTREYFNLLTGSARVHLGLASMAILLVVTSLARFVSSFGLGLTNIPFMFEVAGLLRKNLLARILERPGTR